MLKTEADHTEMSFYYMRINGREETLLEFLLRKFRYLNEQEWMEAILAQHLLVDHREGDPFQILKNNQKIIYIRSDHLEPPVDAEFDIIYEDEDLIAVNKSGDLPTSPSGKYYKNTLVHQVKEKLGWEKIYTLHRLDRETSGVIVFAKRQEVAQMMATMFRERKIEKRYIAILERPLPAPDVFLSVPIGPAIDSPVRIKQWVIPEGKTSQTRFIFQESIGNYTRVEVRPLTGRTHQIRVHAAYLGSPIVGDKLYALKNDGFLQWKDEGESFLVSQNFPTHRQLLHASELRFCHPVTGRPLLIKADDAILTRHLG
ncbi:MAG: RluA family pseudouridine synthase [SAR324 cluster bacterium]|nr:RluA family pseudouridine synthase [SAR324 cluster bacterium]